MRYRVEKENNFWYGYMWNEKHQRWDYIGVCGFTKLECRHLIEKFHKRFNENFENESEEFELR